MKKLFLMLSVALLALTACSNEDNPAEEVTDNVTGSWICQYAEDGINWFDDPYDYIV